MELLSGDQDSDSAVRNTEHPNKTTSASGLNCLEDSIGDLIRAVRGVHLAPGSDGSPTWGTAAGRRTRGSKAVSDDFGPYDLTTAPQSTESRQVNGGNKATSDDFGLQSLEL